MAIFFALSLPYNGTLNNYSPFQGEEGMKRRKLLKAGVMVIIAAGLLALSGCAGPEAGWSIVGAWVNPEYVGSTTGSGPRVEYKTDDTFTAYDDLEGTTVRATGSIEIAEEWTETGSLWLKVIMTVEGDSSSDRKSVV